MALPAPLTRTFNRRKELGPKIVLGQIPAAGGLEFWLGAYIVRDSTTGLGVRALSTDVNANADLRPLGVLSYDRFSDDPEATHALDTRGLADGYWDSQGHLVRGLIFEKNGIHEWQLYNSTATPQVGEKAYLVDETIVRTEATTHGLWVGRFHAPLGDGTTWLVDHQEHGVG